MGCSEFRLLGGSLDLVSLLSNWGYGADNRGSWGQSVDVLSQKITQILNPQP